MKLLLAILCLALVAICYSNEAETEKSEEQKLREEVEALKTNLASMETSLEELRSYLIKLSSQTMAQQFAVEERSRSSSGTGIKLIRSRKRGLKNYESTTYVGNSVYAIHDHANYIRTIGMGEVAVKMNGVDFRTRHNDYKLYQPSTSSKEYRLTEPIEFPEVPPGVKGSLQEQMEEMKLWFKAFKEQNYTERDYREYFKPVLCYMEGAWTLDKQLVEPFKSERHSINAKSWEDLQRKVKFVTMTGTKDAKENLAYLPTTISNVNRTSGASDFAQWNYRILCKPVKDIPFKNLKYVEDLANRVKTGRSKEAVLESRGARFKLYDEDYNDNYQLLDELMYTVPGMDNLPDDDLKQVTFGQGDLYNVERDEDDREVVLKTGYYHRQYKYDKKGANGLSVNTRGFNDENFWVAQTTQEQIAPVCVDICQRELNPDTGRRPIVCREECNRFTYAIPLEIVYMTPLLRWNPYDIIIHQDHKSAVASGGNGFNIPFDGADLNRYYLTPKDFYGTGGGEKDKADTVRNSVQITDSQGNIQNASASGTRIFTDEIEGVGRVRLRYPIAPVAVEDSNLGKELTALKDLFESTTDEEKDISEIAPEIFAFEMSVAVKDPPGEHTHTIEVPNELFLNGLLKGKMVKVPSQQAQQHTHDLNLRFNRKTQTFYYSRCDKKYICWDGHPNTIIPLFDVNKYLDE